MSNNSIIILYHISFFRFCSYKQKKYLISNTKSLIQNGRKKVESETKLLASKKYSFDVREKFIIR